ncbi:Nif3-like dinuclear metal center hexameric protein [bacterium]|nr:Nif3-like dinuclear metal center hexameric protein [bacterium]
MPQPLSSSPALGEITAHLDSLLESERYGSPASKGAPDISWNGLQVAARREDSHVAKVGLAVDSGLSILQHAADAECDLLIVHHGLFWGSCSPKISGIVGEKIRTLVQGGCSLYASHLPLDGDPTFGNAAQIARKLQLQEVSPSFFFNGVPVGVTGRLAEEGARESVIDEARKTIIPAHGETLVRTLSFGTPTVRTIGIATGSASSLLPNAKELGCDLFISGEPKHESYHLAKELRMNALFAGHYFSETFGVRAVGEHITKEYGIPFLFIDEPSGI